MTGGWGAVTLPHRLPVGRMPELAQEARRRHLGRWISGHVCLRSGLTGDRDSGTEDTTLRGEWEGGWGQTPLEVKSLENGTISNNWKGGCEQVLHRSFLLKSSRSAAETHI